MAGACREILVHARRNQGAHAGLILSHYLSTPVNDDKYPAEKEALFCDAKAAVTNCGELYALAFRRWKDSLPFNASRELETRGRLVVGLGSSNVIETGITLHHTYGTPIIPGSSLKGLASHYCGSVWGTKCNEYLPVVSEIRESGGVQVERSGKYYQILFGDNDFSGHIAFHDALITPDSLANGLGLMNDVMAPHHGDYYMAPPADSSSAPTDHDDVTPVPFLAVKGRFLVAVSCDFEGEQGRVWSGLALDLLSDAIEHWGIGAKTNAGYGRMGTPALRERQ